MKEKINKNVYFYLILIGFIAFTQITWRVITEFCPGIPAEYGAKYIEAVMAVGTIFLWKTTDFVQPWLGMKVEKGTGRKTAVTCIAIAVGITALYIIARLVLQNFVPEIAARPFFRTYFWVKLRRFYVFTAIIEELLSKGVLQYGLEKTLPKCGWKVAVAVMAAIFGILHLHQTLYYIIGAMALAVVSGILYHKQGNIWASATLHFFLAFLPRCFGLK